MRKIQVVFLSMFIFLLFTTNVSATLIRYNVTNTIDNLGNELWGYALFDDKPEYIGSPLNIINYYGGEFLFQSVAGSFSGDICSMNLFVNPSEGVVYDMGGAACFRNSGTNKVWGSSMCGIWFDDLVYAAPESYLVLPETIKIRSYYLNDNPGWGGWGINDGYVIPGEYPNLTLTRSTEPVPEPASMLLLGTGLLGLAGLRKRLRK